MSFSLGERKPKKQKTVITNYDIEKMKTVRLEQRVAEIKKKIRQKKREEKKARKIEELPVKMTYEQIKINHKKFQRMPNKDDEYFSLSKARVFLNNINRGTERERNRYYLKYLFLRDNNPKVKIDANRGPDDEVNYIKKELSLRLKNLQNSRNLSYHAREKNKSMKEIRPSKHPLYEESSLDKRKKYTIPEKPEIVNYSCYKPTNCYFDKNKKRKSRKVLTSSTSFNSHAKTKNLPLFTTHMGDIAKEFKQIKTRMKKEELCHKKRNVMSYQEINNLMKTRTDMKLLRLKQKFFDSGLFQSRNRSSSKSTSSFEERLTEKIDEADMEYYTRKYMKVPKGILDEYGIF